MSNDISKLGVAAAIFPPTGHNITKFDAVAVITMPAGNLISKFDVVAVIRAKVLVDSNRRRKGMVPIF